jgi:hypothetical protein
MGRALSQQRLEVLLFAFAPPITLLFVGATFWWLWKRFGRLLIGTLPTVPPHVRRGLIGLYFAVAIPWIAWFGYWALVKNREFAIYALPLVPVGAPALYFVALWIVAGFRRQAEH